MTYEFYSTLGAVACLIYACQQFPVDKLTIVIIGLIDSLIIGRSIYKYSRSVEQVRKYVKWITCERIASLAGWVWLYYAYMNLSLAPDITLWCAGAHGIIYNLAVSLGKSTGVKTQVITI